MNTNPYNYMSKDWSAQQEEFKRIQENAVRDIVLRIIKDGRELPERADDAVRALYVEMTT